MSNKVKNPELAKKAQGLGQQASGNKSLDLLSWAANNWKLVAQIAAVVVAIVFSHTIYQRGSSGVQNLVNAGDAALKSVLLGDKPYLFYCSRGGKTEVPPAVFSQLHAIKSSTVGFGILNCSQIMPSGKSIMDRFGLKKEWRPIIFATAPWMKPKQIPPAQMKDISVMRKYFSQITAARATEVQSDKELKKHCGFGRNVTHDERSVGETCVVLLKGKRHGKKQVELEEWLVKAFPKVKMASVDAAKRRLSFEGSGAVSADDFALKVHALRNGTHYLTMENPMTWDYLNTFVSHAAATPLFDYERDEDKKPLSLVMTGSASSAFKDRSAKFQQQYKGGGQGQDSSSSGSKRSRRDRSAEAKKAAADAAAADAEAEAAGETPEDKAAREAAREARRREQMERQARESLFEESQSQGEADGEPEEDEDIVEL